MATQSHQTQRRRYRKSRRAELEARTRERITEAAVKLHGSVGPARTTVSEIAREAGVQRATVYRHFPDEETLFETCTAHYMARHPLPDPSQWELIPDPEARLRGALEAVYAWYATTEAMLERSSRDAPLVPAMARALEGFFRYFEGMRDELVRGHRERGRKRARTTAAVGHALAFSTWRSLVREQGLDRDEAVELMVGLVAAARR